MEKGIEVQQTSLGSQHEHGLCGNSFCLGFCGVQGCMGGDLFKQCGPSENQTRYVQFSMLFLFNLSSFNQ